MKASPDLVGNSPGIVAVREQVQRLARQVNSRRPPPILIEGETGTGKGLLARLIHAWGPRAQRPFVEVNCAAIPETLLEAELFGYERGAFTDARQAKPGLFQLAHGGSIFLDEIGLLTEAIQTKLLKVIEERSVRRLGGTRSESVDVVVLSATNEDLHTATQERRFRVDLYHRLAVLKLSLPPLRERGGDILLLAEHSLAAVCEDYGLPGHSFSADARAALQRHPWPGNVRELRNVIERAALLADMPVITAAMLGLAEITRATRSAASPAPAPARTPGTSGPGTSTSAERAALEEALQETDWNISRAAARLGLTRNTIRYRMEKYGLQPDAVAERRGRHEPSAVVTRPLPAEAAPAGPRWEARRLTFLRARISPAPAVSAVAARPDVLLDKLTTFGGTVVEAGREVVVGVFGVEPVEDAPRRAVKAAMAMQRAAGEEGSPGSLAIGIHVAPAMIGRVSGAAEIEESSRRAALRVLADLLEQMRGDGVFVSEGAAPFLERRFDLSRVAGAEGTMYRLTGQERAGLGVAGGTADDTPLGLPPTVI